MVSDMDCSGMSHDECQEALRQLYSYLDGQLTIERRTVIKTHIEYCSPCMESYSFETELRQVVSLRCSDQVPEALRRRIADAIRGEIERGPGC